MGEGRERGSEEVGFVRAGDRVLPPPFPYFLPSPCILLSAYPSRPSPAQIRTYLDSRPRLHRVCLCVCLVFVCVFVFVSE